MELSEARFRAMGSACRIAVDLDATTLHQAVHRIEDLEARWSRFVASSEVSKCNAAAGQWIEVSAVTAELFQRAKIAHENTDGRFDPMMLRELEAIGYDRDHSDLALPPSSPTEALGHFQLPSGGRSGHGGQAFPWPGYGGQAFPRPGHGGQAGPQRDFEVEGGAVRVSSGSGFDPGGLGKGMAADLVVADLLDAGATWVMVSLGGDMRFGGEQLADVGWSVGIENPWSLGEPHLNTTIRSGGVATSSTLTRRWRHACLDRHHVLDPATGRPTTGSRAAATVAADESWWADVLAKCLIVDPSMGIDELESLGGRGVAFGYDGEIEHLGLATHEPVR